MRKKSGNQTLTLALSGMMAALVFVATYFFKLPVSITQGYIHLGDGFILLGASLLGWASVPAAAIGSALADLLGGYTLYILPTFVIKGLVAAVAVCALRARHPYWLTVALLVLAELVMVAGYFVTEWLLLGYGLAAAAGAVVPNLVQGFSGVVLGAVLIPLLRRVTPRPCACSPRGTVFSGWSENVMFSGRPDFFCRAVSGVLFLFIQEMLQMLLPYAFPGLIRTDAGRRYIPFFF